MPLEFLACTSKPVKKAEGFKNIFVKLTLEVCRGCFGFMLKYVLLKESALSVV